MKTHYLDYSASTPVDPKVLESMIPFLSDAYGNPSSIHTLGIQNRKAINTARKTMSELLKCQHDELIFTSGGTEAINLAIVGLAKANPSKKRILTTKIEHKATLNSCKHLEHEGYEVIYMDVDDQGFLTLDELKKHVNSNTLLLSLIYGHNEIGTLQRVNELIDYCHAHDVYVHLDAIQVFGKMPITIEDIPCDLMSISAHKIYGPKGVGCLYKKKELDLCPIICGGGHEQSLRAGTENLSGIIGFSKAFELAYQNISERNDHLNQLATYLYVHLKDIFDIKLNGPDIGNDRLPGHLSLSFKDIDAYQLAFSLDHQGIYVSTGSACNSNVIEPSHVIACIQKDPSYAKGTLRITLGYQQTLKDMDEVIEVFKDLLT